MKSIRGFLSVIIFSFLVLSSNLIVYAKSNISALQTGKWLQLSYEDQCDTVDAMVQKIAKEQRIKHSIRTSCYQWPGGAAAAYNTFDCWSICVNMSVFADNSDALADNETVEYHLVKTLAHEVRHSYQLEHMHDDTEYGKAVYDNLTNYISYEASPMNYYEQFIEVDADLFGEDYANKFVKNGKLPQTKFIANDGKLFDAAFYADKYPDVKNVLGTDPQILLNHYNTFGISEHRMANANDIGG